MVSYICRRLLLMIPTLFGIMLLSFAIAQFTPGGPIEQIIARVSGLDHNQTSDISAKAVPSAQQGDKLKYRGSQGLDPEFIASLEKQFGFDKPAHERFFLMIWNYLRFDFGMSYFQDVPVITLIAQKLPVSISLGLWATLISYAISLPLGIAKATRAGTGFDTWTSLVVITGYAIPGFLFALLLIILFAGGSFLDLFPLRDLTSENWGTLPWYKKLIDYLWHMTLPVISMSIGSFAVTTLMTKNAFLEEIEKLYVIAARAKGLTEKYVLYRHVFRNAMLILIAGFPAAFIGAFFTGSFLIETIFSLDGLGLLSFESIVARDYAVVFASLYIFSLMGLFINLIGDLTYIWIDPRIHFGKYDTGKGRAS